jgi:hypothetical protein
VTGRELFHLKTDLYAVTVTCTRPDGTWFGRRTADLNLVDYTRRQQPTSDALFYSLVDSTFQSPQFRRDDWQRVVPLIRPRVSGGSSFYVLYEVYNLATDSAGEHRAEATYELIDEVTRQLAVIPTPSRFVTGPGTTGVAVERVHTMDMKPGRYLIVSRVKDLNSGRTSSLAADFEILPRPE